MPAALACVFLPNSLHPLRISHRARRDSLTPHTHPGVPGVCSVNLKIQGAARSTPVTSKCLGGYVAMWEHKANPHKD